MLTEDPPSGACVVSVTATNSDFPPARFVFDTWTLAIAGTALRGAAGAVAHSTHSGTSTEVSATWTSRKEMVDVYTTHFGPGRSHLPSHFFRCFEEPPRTRRTRRTTARDVGPAPRAVIVRGRASGHWPPEVGLTNSGRGRAFPHAEAVLRDLRGSNTQFLRVLRGSFFGPRQCWRTTASAVTCRERLCQ
jgi:hypothetical protein